jgi:hypothetical protein
MRKSVDLSFSLSHYHSNMTTTFNSDPLLGYLVAYAPRVTVLPFLASFWLEGRAGLALALTLLWHFVVVVPWYGLENCDSVNVQTAYFIVMPVVALGFALLGWVLRNFFLKLPPHMTPVGHLLRSIREGCRSREPHENEIPLPETFPAVSVVVSFVVFIGAWLPSELLVYYGYTSASLTGALFWVNIFLPPGVQVLPLLVWLTYGSKLKKLFGEEHADWKKFIAFLKCFLVAGIISTSFALIAKYANTTILWLWVGALIVAPGLVFLAFVYDQLTREIRAHDYEQVTGIY